MGITDCAADDDGGGGREVPPHELHLTEEELQELIEFNDEPPWRVLDQFRNPYCMACGNYIHHGRPLADRSPQVAHRMEAGGLAVLPGARGPVEVRARHRIHVHTRGD